jgi:Cu/Ag efflux protein CusF
MFRKLIVLATAVACAVALSVGASAQTKQPPAGRKEHAFKGKVAKVDQKTNMITVNNENIPGWMMSMTMTYHVDKNEALKGLKAGDKITATVYDGDFQTLYNVKPAPPDKK